MIQKELNELRRRWRPEKNAVSRIYGCFVNSSKEIVSDLDESLGMMPQEEAEKYLSLLKKGLSGSLGKNLIDIVFSTQQVADSEEHRLLTTLRDSQLKDNEARQAFYRKVIDSLDMGNSSYLLLLACDSYDVPHRGKDDSLQADASDEVFTYIVCVVCPIKEGKVELGYFPGDNEFHCAAGQTVAPPELGFLFPAFDDRAANIYNALFYSRKANEIHQEFIDAIFHVEAPMSAVEQKEAFQSALSDAFDCSLVLEILETAEVAFDGFRQFSGRFALRRFRCELQEVQRMVQHLSGIVEYGAVGCGGYDSNQVFVFILRAWNKVVQVVYVRLQVFTVMVIYCLLTDYRFQRVVCVRKFRHFMCHNHYC